jgi:hypothetical protein
MTTADFMASSSDDVGSNPKEPPHMDIVRAAVQTVPQSMWPNAIRYAGFGLAAAAIGWCVELALGSRVTIPWLPLSATGWPPLGGAVFVVAVATVFGAFYGYFTRVCARWLIMGRLGMPGSAISQVRLRPAWWACWIAEFVVVTTGLTFLLALALIGEWKSKGHGASGPIKWGEVWFVIGMIATFAAVTAGLEPLFNFVRFHFKKLKHALMAWRVVWLTFSATTAVVVSGVVFMILAGIAWASDALATAAGLGPTLALSTAVGLLILAAPLGYTYGKWVWEDRSEWLNPPMPFPRGQLPGQDDFRNWDLEREEHVLGLDADNYPYYLWRESADDRLGLSRPRYCQLRPVGGELYFVFRNPSEDVRPSGGMAVFCIVATAIASTILGAYLLTSWSAALHLKPPLLGMIFTAALMGSVIGAIIGFVWHVLRTLWRWYTDHFSGDGRVHTRPLRLLSGFNMEHAGEVGATINGERAKTGHGLTAVFEDGSMFILTGNAWDYESIVAMHRDLTTLFRLHRDAIVANWDAAQKEQAEVKRRSAPTSQQGPAVAQAVPAAQGGVPDSL